MEAKSYQEQTIIKAWSDTVMKRDAFEGYTFGDRVWEMVEKFLKPQAEITWDKAIRKVVERYKEDNPTSYNNHRTYWNDLKKEWGIE